MFIPCDHCLRKHATHVAHYNDRGEPERLRLCGECYRRLMENLVDRSPLPPDHSERQLEIEESIAQELQANLIGSAIPRILGWDFSAWFRPARKVRGDYYEFFEIDNDHLALLVGDVSGQGIPGGVVITETRALVKSAAVRTTSPAETLVRVNRELYKDIQRGMFVTMYYAVLHPKTATLNCVSAGHNPMVLWRNTTEALHLVNPNGIALGIDAGPLFERTLREEQIQLSPGDRFTIFTDGVVEARNDRNESFGLQRVESLTRGELADLGSSEFLHSVTRELDDFCGEAPQHDDIAIVTCRYKGV